MPVAVGSVDLELVTRVAPEMPPTLLLPNAISPHPPHPSSHPSSFPHPSSSPSSTDPRTRRASCPSPVPVGVVARCRGGTARPVPGRPGRAAGVAVGAGAVGCEGGLGGHVVEHPIDGALLAHGRDGRYGKRGGYVSGDVATVAAVDHN